MEIADSLDQFNYPIFAGLDGYFFVIVDLRELSYFCDFASSSITFSVLPYFTNYYFRMNFPFSLSW